MRGTGWSVPRTPHREAALARLAVAALALSAAVGGCDGGEAAGDADRAARGDAGISERGDAGISVSRTGKGCPGTRPSRTPPFPGEDFNHGNRYLGVAIWSKGRLVSGRRGRSTWGQIMPDGTIYAKLDAGASWAASPVTSSSSSCS
jgi:hypothetical protein